ncbi:MAG: Lon family ATP-dependent protease [bacterium]|jgi:ATP-dependent Lon protease
MKFSLKNLAFGPKAGLPEKLSEDEQLTRQVTALYNLLSNILGPDKLILKAGKLEALNGMRSPDLEEKVLALQKIIYEDPTLDKRPQRSNIPHIISEIEDEMADILARKSVEDRLEKKIAEKMQERHEEYLKEIKMQIVKEDSGPENAATLKKYAILEKLEHRQLSHSAMEVIRPTALSQVVGQDRANKAALAKIASPFPQHVIFYGPPGVGKTTVARLALEEAKKLRHTPFAKDAAFVEVDGATLRWDPREVTNPLIGSVHDPIYQGARKDLAEGGIPEPKTGLVTEAHGGILFIDEIGELDPILLNKLLKVLEDKRVMFDSSYYDPHDPNIPKYIKKLFTEGAPADFILIGATTRDPSEINPAIRSRCAEVFFEPLTPSDIQTIVTAAAERLGVTLAEGAAEVISEYTIEGRKAVNILADCYGLDLYKRRDAGPKTERSVITADIVYEVVQTGRMVPNVSQKASEVPAVGKIFGLGVAGFLGSVLEIEAVAFPAREAGKGYLRFNETAGSMAKDSAFNAASVVRKVTGEEIANYDIHVNIIGGGKIDGPSAGVAILLSIISAIQDRPLRQDIAVTGEVSIRGRVKAVGGIFEKIYGAKQAGIKEVFIPRENDKDVPAELNGLVVTAVDTVEEILGRVFVDSPRNSTDRFGVAGG